METKPISDAYDPTRIPSTPADSAMKKAVKKGDRRACDKALKDGASVETMLICGAFYGNAALCEAARGLGARAFNRMLRAAAEAGFEDITILAREWGATDFNGMLVLGAYGDNPRICQRARDLGATDFKSAIIQAAENGNIETVKLLGKWGDMRADALFGFAKGDNIDLYREFDPTYVTYLSLPAAITGAAAGGHIKLCLRIHEYFTQIRSNMYPHHVNAMLLAATEYNKPKACSLAREWGACDIEGMLDVASKHGYVTLCRMARDWGAHDFNRMLMTSVEASQPEVCHLALEWKADNIDACIKKAIAIRSRIIAEVFVKCCKKKILDIVAYDKELDIPSRIYVCRLFPQFANRVLANALVDVNSMLAHALVKKTKCSINVAVIKMTDYDIENIQIVELAHECGADNFDEMLKIGAKNGSFMGSDCDYSLLFDLCVLINSWGQVSSDAIMYAGSFVACERVCILAYELGSRDFNTMMRNGARHLYGHNICRLARKWGATEFDWLLYYASLGSDEDSSDCMDPIDDLFNTPREQCEVARKWGARNFDMMLIGSIKRFNEELCELALEWGASTKSISIGLEKIIQRGGGSILDFESAIQFAHDHGIVDLLKYEVTLKDWKAEIEQRRKDHDAQHAEKQSQ